MYNTKIIREQGGSVLRFTSGASLVMESGATFSGNVQAISGTSNLVANGASLVIKPAASVKGSMYAVLNMGPNTLWFSPASPGSPISSASPGDMLWIGGSLPSLWLNNSDGTSGSKWTHVGATSSVPAGP